MPNPKESTSIPLTLKKRSCHNKSTEVSKTKISNQHTKKNSIAKHPNTKSSTGKNRTFEPTYQKCMQKNISSMSGQHKNQVKKLHKFYIITTAVKIYKSIPLDIPLEENTIDTDINNILVYPLDDTNTTQEKLNSDHFLCSTPHITDVIYTSTSNTVLR